MESSIDCILSIDRSVTTLPILTRSLSNQILLVKCKFCAGMSKSHIELHPLDRCPYCQNLITSDCITRINC